MVSLACPAHSLVSCERNRDSLETSNSLFALIALVTSEIDHLRPATIAAYTRIHSGVSLGTSNTTYCIAHYTCLSTEMSLKLIDRVQAIIVEAF
jgi:hypothetical protein